MKRNTWRKVDRITDPEGTEWDKFANQDGLICKFESRDLSFKHGRPQAGQSPAVRYARVEDGLKGSFATLRALYAYFPADNK